MKFVTGFIGGILLGVVLAATALYFNPLADTKARDAGLDGWPLHYSLTGPTPLALTHNRQLKLPTHPAGVPLLWESGIAGAVLGVLALTNDEGAVDVVATRFSVPSTKTNPVTSGILVDDYWLLTAPGRGSLYVASTSNQWPMLKDTLLRVDIFRQPWSGPSEYSPVRGPRGRFGDVRGLSGVFAGVVGTASEIVEVKRYGSAGFVEMSGQIMLALQDEDR